MIKVVFQPSDFKQNNFDNPASCPLTRACKRHFNESDIISGCSHVHIFNGAIKKAKYIIKNSFEYADYLIFSRYYAFKLNLLFGNLHKTLI